MGAVRAVRPDAAARAAGGRSADRSGPVYDFTKADVVLSLDADFLACEPGTVRYRRDFAARRRVRAGGTGGVAAGR